MKYAHYVDLFTEIDQPMISNGDEVRRFAFLVAMAVFGMADGFDECDSATCRCHETALPELVSDLVEDLCTAAESHRAHAARCPDAEEATGHEKMARLEENTARFIEGLFAAHREGILRHAFAAAL